MKNQVQTNKVQNIFRIILAIFMIFAGLSHLSFNRLDFHAQVPDWVPLSKDLVVILSGIVEILLGLGLAFWKKERTRFGWALALFFILIFPGNISQYLEGKDAFWCSGFRRSKVKAPIFSTCSYCLGLMVFRRLESLENLKN